MTITLISCLAAALLLWSMLTDYLYAVIPNGVTASVALLFVAFAIASGMPWSGWGSALCAGGLLLGAGFGLFALGVIGGGDAKLLAATALWAGWQGLPDLLMIMGLVGGLVTLPIILFHDRFSHGRLLAGGATVPSARERKTWWLFSAEARPRSCFATRSASSTRPAMPRTRA